MANAKVTDYAALTVPADNDLLEIVDVSDTSMAATSNPIDANVQEVNDVVLLGAGVTGNKWRPT